jgi:undecaprenyl diphosphate synthase
MANRSEFSRLPRHIGVIPDGNRRWAQAHGLPKQAGYAHGLAPALQLCDICRRLGIEELTFYGFTQDNTKRAAVQRRAFQQACVEAVDLLGRQDAEVLVVGNTESAMFPRQLSPYTRRTTFGEGTIRVNLLINYSWQWDLNRVFASSRQKSNAAKVTVNDALLDGMGSAEVSRIDLVIRWGGRRRLSGFLPIQTVYADFCIVDALWPDFQPGQFLNALGWYQRQDVTLGG